MIESDKELDKIISEKNEKKSLISNVTQQTDFNEAVNVAKLDILKEASANDDKFVNEVKSNVKDATLKLTEVEKEKAKLEQQNIQYYQELLQKEQQINEFQKKENYWDNRQKRRDYHFKGVEPIMNFVGIKTPMNLVILYFLTIVLTPFFLIAKLVKGTFGVLISGASDDDRPKAVRGFLWTILGITAVVLLTAIVYLFLKWQNLI